MFLKVSVMESANFFGMNGKKVIMLSMDGEQK